MNELQPLIKDLALILVLAGIVTLLFKKLRQPVVLGYIVAGFLASPNFHYLPSIADTADIDVWAQIGIIVLLFTVGLEFNFKKLLHVGGTAFTTTLTIAIGMIAIGYMAGQLLHFTIFDSIFLGAMLSMSSTMIIIKAFNDLGMQQAPFTQTVFGVLIVQDLMAVVLMVILSSVAAGRVEGSALIGSIAKLIFFLVLWFVVGTYLLPTFIRKIKNYLNEETLLIVAMGLCLGMVVIASYAGFSAALGAFVMGSILSSTVEVERIEKVVQPIKDLFGAVFFISVGMLVNIDALVQYALPIIILSLVVVIGQSTLATIGMLISGQPRQTAIRAGFSLSQIGEFSFIIASLGISLGVMDKFLYPIVVAVSVVTTFTTPYMIKLAKPFAEKIEPIIPSRIKELLDNYAASKTEIQESKAWWKVVAANYIGNILIYGILCIAIMIAAHLWLFPLMADLIPGHIGTLIGTIITLTTMAPFLWAMSMRKINTQIIRTLRIEKGVNQVPLVLLFVLRYLTAIALVIGFLLTVYSYIGMFIGLAIFAISMLLFSKTIQKQFGKLEENFYNNLNQRELSRKGHGLIHNLQIATMKLQETSPLAGVKLMESDIRNKYGVNIVSISRGARRINIPGGDVRLFPGDTIGVIGTAEQIHDFLPIAESGEIKNAVTSSQEVKYAYVSISEQSAWRGQTIRNLHLRDRYHCLLVGIERDKDTFLHPDGSTTLAADDVIWIAGEPSAIAEVRRMAYGQQSPQTTSKKRRQKTA